MWSSGYESSSGVQTTLVLLLVSCAVRGDLPNISASQFPHWRNGNNDNTDLTRLLHSERKQSVSGSEHSACPR